MTGRNLTIVIPAFNEERAIASTLSDLKARLPDSEIIVVDDGSSDTTAAVVSNVAGVRLVQHAYNAGYGASVKTGMRLSTRKYVAWFDADNEHRPDDLVALLNLAVDENLVAAIGRRRLRHGPLVRIVGKTLILAVARSLDIRDGSDLNCGLRVFRRDVILTYLPLLPDGFSASLTSTMIMIERRHPVAFAPVTIGTRIGDSKVHLRDGVASLMLVLRMIMLFAPLRIFLRTGVVLASGGLVYGLLVALSRGQGFPAAAVLAVVVGFLLCMLGLIADQISELRMDRFRTALPTLPEPASTAESSPDKTR